MRIVALALVGVALIAGAFGLGRVTRASADDPKPPRAVATPVPLEASQPVSASVTSEAPAPLPALRPVPRKPKKKPQTTTSSPPSGSSTSTPPPSATTAPSTPQPSTPAPSKPKPKQPSKPVEEIG